MKNWKYIGILTHRNFFSSVSAKLNRWFRGEIKYECPECHQGWTEEEVKSAETKAKKKFFELYETGKLKDLSTYDSKTGKWTIII